MSKKDIKIFNNAIKKWGKESQILVAVEEIGELLQSISKFNRGKITTDDILEEIADVEIMLNQLIIIYSCHDSYNTILNKKFAKLKRLLNNEI